MSADFRASILPLLFLSNVGARGPFLITALVLAVYAVTFGGYVAFSVYLPTW